MKIEFSCFVALLAAMACARVAHASTVSMRCQDKDDAGATSAMTLVYDGDASGTLKVKGAFGEMALPATKEERVGDGDGIELVATGIRAFGKASVLMPDKVAIESCVARKLTIEEMADEDIVSTILGSCITAAAGELKTVEIKASVEIGIFDPPSVEVFVKRTFLEKSLLPGGKLTIESLPPPVCSLAH